MMVVGWLILKKERIVAQSVRDERNLNPEEVVVFKQVGDISIVTVTNQRVRFYGTGVSNLRYSATNLPASDKEDYYITEIKSVRAINSTEFSSRKLVKKYSSAWGIQLVLNNHITVNIPVTEQEKVAAHISQLIR